jgi:hypothetical protein
MLYNGVCPKLFLGMFNLFDSGPKLCEGLAANLESSTFYMSAVIFALLLIARRRRASQRKILVDADQQGQGQLILDRGAMGSDPPGLTPTP